MIGLFLRSALSSIWGRIQGLVSLAGRYPLQAALIASLALCGVQTWRLSGVKQSLTTARAQIVALRAASDQAAKAQAELRAKERQEYQERADHADTEYRAALADARTATAAYIARNRVRAGSGGSTPVAIGSPDPAGIRAEVPADTLVAVEQSDVQGFADCAVYAVNLRNAFISITEP